MQYRRLISALLALSLCIYSMLPCAFAESTSFLADNFDTYLSDGGIAPTGWSVNASDTNADYDIYSISTERGRSVGLTQYSSTTQVQFNRTFAGPSGKTYAFEISVKRPALLSDFTMALRTNGTPSSFSIELMSNGSIKAMGDAVSGFTYSAGEWLDLKLVFMPDIAKYTFVAHQGDNYIAKTANLSGSPAIKDFRFYFPAGTHADGNTILIDDVKVYTCDDIVIPKTESETVTFAQANSYPASGSTGVSTDAKVKIWFNEAAINTDMTDVFAINDVAVDASRVTLADDGLSVMADLNGVLDLNTAYTLSYNSITNADEEVLAGSVTFKTAEKEYTLSDIRTSFDADNNEYSMFLGGKSNTGSNQNIKVCFTMYDYDGTLKDILIKDIPLAAIWAETPVTVPVPENASIGEVYFLDSIYNMNIKEPKNTFMGESVNAFSYNGGKELEYSIDYARSKLTLSGIGAQGTVSVAVLKPNHTIDELSGTNEAAENAIEYFAQKTCGEDGTFSVSHILSGGEGEYTVLVNRHDGNGVKEYTNFVFYMTQESINSAVSDYNADDADYATLIGQTARAFNIDLTHYNSLDDELGGKDKVYDALKAGRPYSLPGQIALIVEQNSLLQAMNEAESEDEFGELLWNNTNLLNLESSDIYSIYEDFGDRIESSVGEVLYDSNYDNLVELTKAFNDGIILSAVKESELYTEVKTVLEASFEYLEWDLSDYEDVKQVKSIYSAIKGRSYDTIEDLWDDFDDEVRAQLKAESNKKKSSSGGGGGGSSIGKTVTMTPNDKVLSEEEQIPEVSDDIKPYDNVEFVDMDGHEWAKEAVSALAKKGIINGKEPDKFYPSDVLKREEMVKLIVCAFEKSLTAQNSNGNFNDTDNNAWYMPYIDKAYANGIVNGVGNGSFGIGAEITRQDLAVMCVRAAEIAGVEFSIVEAPEFSDVNMIDSYALEAVSKLYNAGIMVGDGDGRFRPDAVATRAEVAKILYMILQKGMMI